VKKKYLLLAAIVSISAGWQQPERLEYFNLYADTPRVRILPFAYTYDAIQESDEQYRILSYFSNDFVLKGSSFFVSDASGVRMVKSRGSVSQIFRDVPQVVRLDLAFTRRGLNTASLVFTDEPPIPTWAESIEFWGHGIGIRHGYRLVYRDEAGQHFTLDFGMTNHYGWKRFAAAIPLRAMERLSFAERYRALRLVELVILDDYANATRRSLIHLTNLAISRIRRTMENQQEFWVHTPVYVFNQDTLPNIQMRAFGYTNFRANPVSADSAGLKDAATPVENVLVLDADYSAQDLHRIVLRFTPPASIEVCRKIILTLRGERRGEKVSLVVKNSYGDHFLVRFGEIQFTGWQKITADVPEWVIQHTRIAKGTYPLTFLELLIEPGAEPYFREGVHLAIGGISAVEDTGTPPLPAIEVGSE
jgi:hypothetical protein